MGVISTLCSPAFSPERPLLRMRTGSGEHAPASPAPLAPPPSPTLASPISTPAGIFGFSGALPERLNGRLAMLALSAAAAAEVNGAGPVTQQLQEAPTAVVAAVALFTVASLVPILKARLRLRQPLRPDIRLDLPGSEGGPSPEIQT